MQAKARIGPVIFYYMYQWLGRPGASVAAAGVNFSDSQTDAVKRNVPLWRHHIASPDLGSSGQASPGWRHRRSHSWCSGRLGDRAGSQDCMSKDRSGRAAAGANRRLAAIGVAFTGVLCRPDCRQASVLPGHSTPPVGVGHDACQHPKQCRVAGGHCFRRRPRVDQAQAWGDIENG